MRAKSRGACPTGPQCSPRRCTSPRDLRRRERTSWTFRLNRLLTRAARHAHLTKPCPEGTPYSRFGEQGSGASFGTFVQLILSRRLRGRLKRPAADLWISPKAPDGPRSWWRPRETAAPRPPIAGAGALSDPLAQRWVTELLLLEYHLLIALAHGALEGLRHG